MSEEAKKEEKKPMTLEEITQEFNQVSAQAGWLQFRIAVDSQEIQKKYVRMSELNDMAAKMKAAEGKKDGSAAA